MGAVTNTGGVSTNIEERREERANPSRKKSMCEVLEVRKYCKFGK